MTYALADFDEYGHLQGDGCTWSVGDTSPCDCATHLIEIARQTPVERLGQIDPGTVLVWCTDNQSPSVVAPMQKALVQAAGHADFLLLVCGQGSDLSLLDEDAMMAAGWVKASSVADQMFTVDECQTCGGTGTVPHTPGLGSDGFDPCPVCTML